MAPNGWHSNCLHELFEAEDCGWPPEELGVRFPNGSVMHLSKSGHAIWIGKPVEIPAAANDNRPTAPSSRAAPLAQPLRLPPMHPAPFTPETAGGLLCNISNWITSTAIVPVPELSLAAAIALLAGVFGKVALTPTRAGVNVYLTTLLGTAGGKGWPAKAIRTLSDQPGTVGAVTNGDPTSYAAMERILRKQSSTVVVFDEFGITLQDVNAKHKNSVAAGIRKFLLAVYDQSNSVRWSHLCQCGDEEGRGADHRAGAHSAWNDNRRDAVRWPVRSQHC